MINTLIELSKGQYAGNIDRLKAFVMNGKEEAFQKLLNGCDSFSYDGGELLIYKEGKIIYSCCVTEYCGELFVTEMYGEFDLVYESEVDYNSERMKCLSDLYRTKQRFTKRWIKELDWIYQKYDAELVDSVRNEFGYEETTPRKYPDDYFIHKVRIKQGIVNHLSGLYEVSDKVRTELNDQILICEGLNKPITVELIQELVFLPFNRMMDRIGKHKYA